MGYRLGPRPEFTIAIDEGDFAGFRAVMRGGVFLGDLLLVKRLLAPETTPDDRYEEALAALAENIISWEVEDQDGQPVPPTLDSLKSMVDAGLIFRIVTLWSRGIREQPAPFGPPSSDTELA